MDERPIPRPNNLTTERWNALDREEQVKWWMREAPHAEHFRPLREITLYEGGITTKFEAANAILEKLDSDGIQDVLLRTPPEVLALIRKSVASFPADDDDQAWRSRPVYLGNAVMDPMTEEEFEQHKRQMQAHTRRQVRTFRAADKRRVIDES